MPTEEGSVAVQFTDIVKARALKRAGRACEMCGVPLGFESAHFVSAHPIFGIVFDQDDCCVLCDDCLADLDPDTRAAAGGTPRPSALPHEAGSSPDGLGEADLGAPEGVEGERRADARDTGEEEPLKPTALPRSARESWLPRQDPDGGMCA